MTSQHASGAPRVSAVKRFAQHNLGTVRIHFGMGIMQKQLDELHIAIVKPED